MLACQLLPGHIWVNCCGTFGISSAAYWWSKLSSGVLRAVYCMLGPDLPLELLLFADDLEMTAANALERSAIVHTVFFLLILGSPLKWSKFRGGFSVDWIGLHICNKTYRVGLSEARARWLREWIARTIEAGRVHVREMAGGVGRMNFAANALHYERPWLGPLYLWLSALVRSELEIAVIPWAIRMVMRWIAKRLDGEGRLMAAPELPMHCGDLFRSDAKAEGGRAWVGGWLCQQGTPASKARWYSSEITKETAPWVFAKAADPNSVISDA
jgi:hypothetical protein